jgi:hypothetical protein
MDVRPSPASPHAFSVAEPSYLSSREMVHLASVIMMSQQCHGLCVRLSLSATGAIVVGNRGNHD